MIPLYGIAGRIFRSLRPVRDPHYLQFIRTCPCVGCGTSRGQREAMHTGPRGLGQKASDLDALPGCHACHRELHAIGAARFQSRHKIDFAGLITMLRGFTPWNFQDGKSRRANAAKRPLGGKHDRRMIDALERGIRGRPTACRGVGEAVKL